jgi:hypothetical protein
MNSANTLDEEPYSQPLIYSDEASLLDLYHRLVRHNGWKEDYLAPSGASWPNIRVWNGSDFDIGYVNKSDARVNLIVQSPTPPFELLIGYNIGEEFASMESDYRIKQRVNRAFERTKETLSNISDVFENDSVTEYRVLIQSVDPGLDDPHQRASRLQQSISDSLDQPNRTLGYQTYPVDDRVKRIVNFHDDFPGEEAENFRDLLIDD